MTNASMAKGERPTRERSGKMHQLFIDLYLSDDSDGSAEERKAGRKARRRNIIQKRITRRLAFWARHALRSVAVSAQPLPRGGR